MPRRSAAAPAPAPRLVFEAGPTTGARVVPLRRDVLVGRDSACDVVLADPHVDDRHARLHVGDDTVVVVDLGSASGTTVNGRAVPPGGTRLAGGDRIRFGPVQARIDDPWRRSRPETPATAPPTDTVPARHVFISSGRADAQFVGPIARRLEDAGHDVSVGADALAAGPASSGQVTDAIERSDAFVVVLTSRSVASPEVGREVHLAAATRLPIIPVAVTPVRIPGHLEYPLSGLQRIEVSEEEPHLAAGKVLDALEQRLPSRQWIGVRPRVLDALAVVLVTLGLGLGVATAVTGALPPWAEQARCNDVMLRVEPVPPLSTASGSDAELTVRIVNASDDPVRVLGDPDVQVVAEDGFRYGVERPPALGSWLHGVAVGPQDVVERRLAVDVPASRGASDRVSVEISSIVEGRLPLLRCRAVAEDVPLRSER